MSISPSSAPVQRTDSSPIGVIWSKATAPSRNSSSSARNRATVVSRSGESADSARNVMVPCRRSRPTTSVACSRTLTAGAWMCASDSSCTGLGSSARCASAESSSRPSPISTSGSSVANRSSSPTARGNRLASPAIRCSSTPATCLNALYCISRANSRSRASSSARSSSSSTSPWGSSRAALRSSRVEATSRNEEVCSSSQSRPACLMKAMNSSVTCDSATSVMSSLCLAIRLSSRSNGPSKLSRRTANALPDSSVRASSSTRAVMPGADGSRSRCRRRSRAGRPA